MTMHPSRAGVLGLLLVLGACATHEVVPPEQPTTAMPTSFASSDGEVAPEPFWREFGDEALERLVLEALAANRDLEVAWARLASARAQAAVADAADALTVDVAAEPSARYFADHDVPDGQGGAQSVHSRTFGWHLGLSASWAADLFGAIEHREQAARLTAAAARQRAEETALLVAGLVVEAWLDAAEAQALLDVLAAQEAASQSLLELSELRFDTGGGSALAILQQREQLAAVRSERPAIEAALSLARQRLALLCGRPPRQLDGLALSGSLPQLAPLTAVGTPVELLDRRPDLRAARLEVVAADHHVAAAVADRLPQLNLLGAIGLAKTAGSGVFDQESASITAAFFAPLLDGGRRAAQVRRENAVLWERLASWSSLFLNALGEVEGAMVRADRQAVTLELLRERERLATETLAEARHRFANGDGAYLDVLQSVQNLQAIERQLVLNHRLALALRLDLHLSLGANWTQSLIPATPPSENSHE